MQYEEILTSRGHKAIYGIFNRRTSVERAVDALKGQNFRHTDIHVVMSQMGETKRFAEENRIVLPTVEQMDLMKTLTSIGIPEDEADLYEELVMQNGILLSVFVDDAKWAESAKQIFKTCGAQNISATIESRDDFKDFHTTTPLDYYDNNLSNSIH